MPALINGAHTIVYAKEAEKARAFLRDVLRFPVVDAGGGWLIFKAPPSEIAVHPGATTRRPHHELFLMCRDINQCVRRLEQKGVKFAPITDQGYGLMTRFELPGAGEIGLYEPKHPSPLPVFTRNRASRRQVAPSHARTRRRAARPSRGSDRR
jgi:catechol 2,3-dioxygenase-like lactoylglutathione lyase family enzyme